MLSMNECALMSLPWHMRTKSPSRSDSLRSALSWEARSTVAKLILVFSEHCSRPTAHVGLKRKKDPLCRISPRIRWPIIEQADYAFRSPCPITAKPKPAQSLITESVETAGQKTLLNPHPSLHIRICWNCLKSKGWIPLCLFRMRAMNICWNFVLSRQISSLCSFVYFCLFLMQLENGWTNILELFSVEASLAGTINSLLSFAKSFHHQSFSPS